MALELEFHQYGNCNDPKSAVLVFPGRGQHAYDMMDAYSHMGLNESIIIGITPNEKSWYPLPKGAKDQADALKGLSEAVIQIENEVIPEIISTLDIPRKKLAFVGFSAGGAMALQVALMGKSPVACIVCHAGCILDPNNIPEASPQFQKMPILLTHCQDDETFDWKERYMPTRDSLSDKKYKVYKIERKKGGHTMFTNDIIIASRLLAKSLDYEF